MIVVLIICFVVVLVSAIILSIQKEKLTNEVKTLKYVMKAICNKSLLLPKYNIGETVRIKMTHSYVGVITKVKILYNKNQRCNFQYDYLVLIDDVSSSRKGDEIWCKDVDIEKINKNGQRF